MLHFTASYCFKCHFGLYFGCGVCGVFGCLRQILRFWADKYNLLWGARRHRSLAASWSIQTSSNKTRSNTTCINMSYFIIDPLLISFDLLSLCVCIFVSGVPWFSIMFLKKCSIKWLAFHKFVTLKAASLWYEDGQRGHWQHVLCCLDAIGCNARYAPICSLQDLDLTMFDLSSEDPELFELLWTKSLLQRRPTSADWNWSNHMCYTLLSYSSSHSFTTVTWSCYENCPA